MTGSIASVKGFPGFSVYAASKAALHSFARGWLNEPKGRNIRVNVLSPGQIATPIQEQLFDEGTKFVPADHPLRPVRLLVNEALKRLNGLFSVIYAEAAERSYEHDIHNARLAKPVSTAC